jgi:glycosyltransferase involved in cell wall biosynthesis
VTEKQPPLSIGLAVRNGGRDVERCIDSILSQDFTDFELVICDNASDDGTTETLERYARSDKRVKLSVNSINIGSHENMKLVLERSRGTFFRWISADDWLKPRCLSTCVRALESCRDAIGVTTWFALHLPDGSVRHAEYAEGFPTSPDSVSRFERMVWVCHGAKANYDPVYGMYRREHLMRCHPLRPSERADWLLSVELALAGRIINVDEELANRTLTANVGVDRAAFRRRLDPVRGERIRTSPRRLSRQMFALAVSADLTEAQLRRCKRAVRRFWFKEMIRSVRNRLSDMRRRGLGILGRELGRHSKARVGMGGSSRRTPL